MIPADSRHSVVLVDMHILAGERVVGVDILEADNLVVCADISKGFLCSCTILTGSHSEEDSLEVAARSSGVVVHSFVAVHCNIPAVVGSYAADPVQGRTT